MRLLTLTCLIVLNSAPLARALVVDGKVVRPVTTYSIIARDPDTGQLGAAVQSHWFSVGSVVPWVEAGVGAVATQSLTEVSYGPLGLALLRAGKTPDQALRALIEADETPEWRQVGIVDAAGERAVHTGRKCIREAGHVSGENFIVMANLMEKSTVWEAMAGAFRNSSGDLTERLLSALEAAQAEGGDIRGMQSAAIIVVTGRPSGIPYRDRIVDLRVEDHDDPLRELRRLVSINRAYRFMNEGDEYLANNDPDAAMSAYAEAMELAPSIVEIRFWSALTLFTNGHEEEALALFEEVFAREPKWTELVKRLPLSGLLGNDEGQVDRILGAADQ